MDFPDHPLWDFALGVYRREGVGAACLNLQDRHGIDVNIMLFCLWLGDSGRGVLDGDEMAAVLGASDEWHALVVKGLRAVRKGMKDAFSDVPPHLRDGLRAGVQALEIDSEHVEQLILAGAVKRGGEDGDLSVNDRAHAATRNFDLYLDSKGIIFATRDAVDYAHILGQAFPGITADDALDFAELLM